MRHKTLLVWAFCLLCSPALADEDNENNGLRANFSGDLPTLIVQNIDQPGHVNEVTGMLTKRGINIATLQLYRDHPGGNAVMIIETDKAVPPDGLAWLERCEGITRVTFIDAEREE